MSPACVPASKCVDERDSVRAVIGDLVVSRSCANYTACGSAPKIRQSGMDKEARELDAYLMDITLGLVLIAAEPCPPPPTASTPDSSARPKLLAPRA